MFSNFVKQYKLFFYSVKEDLAESRITRVNENKAIDEKYGFSSPKESGEKIGYLVNMHTVMTQFIASMYSIIGHISFPD